MPDFVIPALKTWQKIRYPRRESMNKTPDFSVVKLCKNHRKYAFRCCAWERGNILLDQQDWQVREGYPLTITALDAGGSPIGHLPVDQNVVPGKQRLVNAASQLEFVYTAGTTPGVAQISVYATYGVNSPENLIGQISITLTP